MKVFSNFIRVRYADTDQMGVVYHANYLRYFECSRAEMLRSQGFTYREVEAQGVQLMVVHAELDYHRPAHYDDLIEVRTQALKLGAASILLSSEVWLDGVLLVSGKIKLAAVDIATGKVTAVPLALRQAVAGEE